MVSISVLPQDAKGLRDLIRKGELVRPTSGLAPRHVQANLAILPYDLAFDFLLFCQRNPKACPAVEVLEPGKTEPKITAPGADVRTDLPKYRIFRHGELEAEVEDIADYWRDDLVSFLLGCSHSFESALMAAGVPMRNIEEGKAPAVYTTNVPTTPAGAFSGPLVVSMRPIPEDKIVRAVQVTSRLPLAHGAPIHLGDPSVLGIDDLSRVDEGDAVEVRDGDVPVFWACGVTPQVVARASKPPLMITHAPGHMFITDLYDEDLAVI